MNFILDQDHKLDYIIKLRSRIKYLLEVRYLFINENHRDLIEYHFEGKVLNIKKIDYDIDILWYIGLLKFFEEDYLPVEFICTEHEEPQWVKDIILK
jgi:hypothetical protein